MSIDGLSIGEQSIKPPFDSPAQNTLDSMPLFLARAEEKRPTVQRKITEVLQPHGIAESEAIEGISDALAAQVRSVNAFLHYDRTVFPTKECGRIVYNSDGEIYIPTKSQAGKVAAAKTAVVTEAAISSLFVGGPTVASLPPESFEYTGEQALTDEIDSEGLDVTGKLQPGKNVKTAIYKIPSQLLDANRRPIATELQRMLIIQTETYPDSRFERRYSIGTIEGIKERVSL